MTTSSFQHVTYAWDDEQAAQLDPVARLVYRSNLLGADGRITNTGGGNTGGGNGGGNGRGNSGGNNGNG